MATVLHRILTMLASFFAVPVYINIYIYIYFFFAFSVHFDAGKSKEINKKLINTVIVPKKRPMQRRGSLLYYG